MTSISAAITRTSRSIRRSAYTLLVQLTRKARLKLALTISLPPFVKMAIYYEADLSAPANDNKPRRRRKRPSGFRPDGRNPTPGLTPGVGFLDRFYGRRATSTETWLVTVCADCVGLITFAGIAIIGRIEKPNVRPLGPAENAPPEGRATRQPQQGR